MINKKYLNLLRSKTKNDQNNFIYEKVSERIIDSIDLLKVDFKEILEIGINDKTISSYLLNRFSDCNINSSDVTKLRYKINKRTNFQKLDIDYWSFNENYYDLIYSNLFIHAYPSLNNVLKSVYKSLKSNSFFIATIPEKNNMLEFINLMYETDIEVYGGAYQRSIPNKDVNEILSTLKNNNFDIPTINSDKFTIEYDNFEKLLLDLKLTNLSYFYQDKKQNFEKKNYFKYLEKNYIKNNNSKKFILDIKINVISAWKK